MGWDRDDANTGFGLGHPDYRFTAHPGDGPADSEYTLFGVDVLAAQLHELPEAQAAPCGE